MDNKRSYLYLRLRRKEISELFRNIRSKTALKKAILRGLVLNFGPLAGVGGGTNPPNLPPSLRPWKSGGEAAGVSFLRTSRLRALVVDV